METYAFRLNSKLKKNFTCPACGQHTFSPYVSAVTGLPLDPAVGRCDRINNCCYHLTPREFFAQGGTRPDEEIAPMPYNAPIEIVDPDFVPADFYIKFSDPSDTSLYRYLADLIGEERIKGAFHHFRVKSAGFDRVIFPQIDADGRLRTGKVIQYDSKGHRIKSHRNGASWLHSQYKADAGLENFNLRQCLFGEYQAVKNPDLMVICVESEKTAVVMKALMPCYAWVATGGCSGLKPEKFEPLRGRQVLIAPDADMVTDWSWKVKQIKSICDAHLWTSWMSGASAEHGDDLADIWLRKLHTAKNDKRNHPC